MPMAPPCAKSLHWLNARCESVLQANTHKEAKKSQIQKFPFPPKIEERYCGDADVALPSLLGACSFFHKDHQNYKFQPQAMGGPKTYSRRFATSKIAL